MTSLDRKVQKQTQMLGHRYTWSVSEMEVAEEWDRGESELMGGVQGATKALRGLVSLESLDKGLSQGFPSY